jgi:mono/diheme cytochrome c family protein
MRRNRFTYITAALVAAGIAAFSGAGLAQPDAVYPAPNEPEMTPRLQLGMMNYGAYCASCHGKTGGGSDKGPTFIHRVYHPGHHGDGAFFTAPKRGARAHHWKFGDMKPVEGVTDAQLELIVEYVRAVQQANGLF